MEEEPSSKRTKVAPRAVLRPRLDSLRELSTFVLLQHARSLVVAPQEVTTQLIAMMKRFNWVGSFLLQCLLGTHLTFVDLSNSHQVDNSSVELLASCCPQLVNVSLAFCVRVSSVAALGRCAQLRIVNLSSCVRITSLAHLKCPMHEVVLAGLRHLMDLPADCSQIIMLDLTGCRLIRDVNVPTTLETLFVVDCAAGNDNLMLLLAERCQSSLRRLFVGGVSCEITDVGILSVLRDCSKLEELGVKTIPLLSHRVGEELAKSRLRSLAVLDCDNIGKLEGLSRLQRLDVQGDLSVSESLFRQLEAVSVNHILCLPAQLNGALTKLAFRNCVLSDEIVKGMLDGCKFLAHIDLSTSGHSAITDDAFVGGLCHLDHVNLSGNTRVTDEGVWRLIGESSVSLTWLSVRWLAVGDALFARAVLPSLSSLDVSNCASITVTAVQTVQRNCPKLTKLSASYCAQLVLDSLLVDAIRNLSDVRFDGLVVRGPIVLTHPKNFDLKTLTLMGCENLLDDDLSSLLGGFQNIVHLDISFNTQISAKSLVAMCGKHRNLTILRLGGMMQQIGESAVTTIARMGKQIVA